MCFIDENSGCVLSMRMVSVFYGSESLLCGRILGEQ